MRNLLRSRVKSGLTQPRKEAVHRPARLMVGGSTPPSKIRDDGRNASDLDSRQSRQVRPGRSQRGVIVRRKQHDETRSSSCGRKPCDDPAETVYGRGYGPNRSTAGMLVKQGTGSKD